MDYDGFIHLTDVITGKVFLLKGGDRPDRIYACILSRRADDRPLSGSLKNIIWRAYLCQNI